ncbi:hypothetical protein WDU94_014785 [Cyamophila willieti]
MKFARVAIVFSVCTVISCSNNSVEVPNSILDTVGDYFSSFWTPHNEIEPRKRKVQETPEIQSPTEEEVSTVHALPHPNLTNRSEFQSDKSKGKHEPPDASSRSIINANSLEPLSANKTCSNTTTNSNGSSDASHNPPEEGPNIMFGESPGLDKKKCTATTKSPCTSSGEKQQSNQPGNSNNMGHPESEKVGEDIKKGKIENLGLKVQDLDNSSLDHASGYVNSFWIPAKEDPKQQKRDVRKLDYNQTGLSHPSQGLDILLGSNENISRLNSDLGSHPLKEDYPKNNKTSNTSNRVNEVDNSVLDHVSDYVNSFWAPSNEAEKRSTNGEQKTSSHLTLPEETYINNMKPNMTHPLSTDSRSLSTKSDSSFGNKGRQLNDKIKNVDNSVLDVALLNKNNSGHENPPEDPSASKKGGNPNNVDKSEPLNDTSGRIPDKAHSQANNNEPINPNNLEPGDNLGEIVRNHSDPSLAKKGNPNDKVNQVDNSVLDMASDYVNSFWSPSNEAEKKPANKQPNESHRDIGPLKGTNNRILDKTQLNNTDTKPNIDQPKSIDNGPSKTNNLRNGNISGDTVKNNPDHPSSTNKGGKSNDKVNNVDNSVLDHVSDYVNSVWPPSNEGELKSNNKNMDPSQKRNDDLQHGMGNDPNHDENKQSCNHSSTTPCAQRKIDPNETQRKIEPLNDTSGRLPEKAHSQANNGPYNPNNLEHGDNSDYVNSGFWAPSNEGELKSNNKNMDPSQKRNDDLQHGMGNDPNHNENKQSCNHSSTTPCDQRKIVPKETQRKIEPLKPFTCQNGRKPNDKVNQVDNSVLDMASDYVNSFWSPSNEAEKRPANKQPNESHRDIGPLKDTNNRILDKTQLNNTDTKPNIEQPKSIDNGPSKTNNLRNGNISGDTVKNNSDQPSSTNTGGKSNDKENNVDNSVLNLASDYMNSLWSPSNEAEKKQTNKEQIDNKRGNETLKESNGKIPVKAQSNDADTIHNIPHPQSPPNGSLKTNNSKQEGTLGDTNKGSEPLSGNKGGNTIDKVNNVDNSVMDHVSDYVNSFWAPSNEAEKKPVNKEQKENHTGIEPSKHSNDKSPNTKEQSDNNRANETPTYSTGRILENTQMKNTTPNIPHAQSNQNGILNTNNPGYEYSPGDSNNLNNSKPSTSKKGENPNNKVNNVDNSVLDHVSDYVNSVWSPSNEGELKSNNNNKQNMDPSKKGNDDLQHGMGNDPNHNENKQSCNHSTTPNAKTATKNQRNSEQISQTNTKQLTHDWNPEYDDPEYIDDTLKPIKCSTKGQSNSDGQLNNNRTLPNGHSGKNTTNISTTPCVKTIMKNQSNVDLIRPTTKKNSDDWNPEYDDPEYVDDTSKSVKFSTKAYSSKKSKPKDMTSPSCTKSTTELHRERILWTLLTQYSKSTNQFTNPTTQLPTSTTPCNHSIPQHAISTTPCTHPTTKRASEQTKNSLVSTVMVSPIFHFREFIFTKSTKGTTSTIHSTCTHTTIEPATHTTPEQTTHKTPCTHTTTEPTTPSTHTTTKATTHTKACTQTTTELKTPTPSNHITAVPATQTTPCTTASKLPPIFHFREFIFTRTSKACTHTTTEPITHTRPCNTTTRPTTHTTTYTHTPKEPTAHKTPCTHTTTEPTTPSTHTTTKATTHTKACTQTTTELKTPTPSNHTTAVPATQTTPCTTASKLPPIFHFREFIFTRTSKACTHTTTEPITHTRPCNTTTRPTTQTTTYTHTPKEPTSPITPCTHKTTEPKTHTTPCTHTTNEPTTYTTPCTHTTTEQTTHTTAVPTTHTTPCTYSTTEQTTHTTCSTNNSYNNVYS